MNNKGKKNGDTARQVDADVYELLRHIDHENLKQFAAQYAFRQPAFKKDIFAHFNPQNTSKSLAGYREEVAMIFSFEGTGMYKESYDYFDAAQDAAGVLHALIEKAVYLMSKNNFEEVAAIAQSVIEAVPRNYEIVDDSDGDLADEFKSAVALLVEMAANKGPRKTLKEQIFHWVKKEVKEKIYSDYGFDEMDDLFLTYTSAAGSFSDALAIVDERIKNADGDYFLQSAVNNKIQLLQQNDRPDEVEEVITEYIHLSGIRKLRIDELLSQKHYTGAIELIKEGIKVAQKKASPNDVNDWKDQLLGLYIKLKDKNNILQQAEDLFHHGSDAIKYYHILKKHTAKDQWAAYLDTLLSRGKPGSMYGSSDHSLAEIYIEEEQWEPLMRLVEKSGLSGLENYGKYLKTRFPAKMLTLYAKEVSQYAEDNVGREYYKMVADMLKKMRSYPEGNKVVDKLLAEFRAKYKLRRAMMEELKRV